MRDEILTYAEMCLREGMSLQKGMNFSTPSGISIVLMSRRRNAPYQDEMSDDATELIYEGHDVPRSPGVDPKREDQPLTSANGRLTENGKFARAAQEPGAAHQVRVYEKLQPGIRSDKGLFDLAGVEYVESAGRKVFKFHMRLSHEQTGQLTPPLMAADGPASRMIPGWVKQEVYKRDGGACVLCGARDNLHFDHEFPYSKGGASITPANVRILCARHNLAKGAKIE